MAGQEHPTRLWLDLRHDWAFLKRRAGRRWLAGLVRSGTEDDQVDLPHCWNAKDSFQENVRYYRGYGSYRKLFRMPINAAAAGDTLWFLESEGFYGTGDVWLNGSKVAKVDGQYLGFLIDVTEHLSRDSENVLGIRLTNRCRTHVLPGIRMPDFLLYGGLSGRVWLQRMSMLHLDTSRTRINAVGRESAVSIDFAIVNRSERDRRCTVRWTVVDMDGNELSGTEPLKIDVKRRNDSGDLTVRMTVPRARLWSPGSPCLYRVICRILEDGRLLDCVGERFGFREAVFKPGQGFFLNGERVELRGCNRHESMPGFGRALPEKLHREDAVLIKKLGCNFVRLSHYPQHPCFLDACDELGIMVYAEIATWKSVRGGRWLKSACRQMHDMIVRDRNHPSVILWGMGNESRSRQAYLKLRDIARRLDPARPVIYAENHLYRARRKKTIGIPDVWGTNYELDVLDEGCNASRLRSVVVSECSSYPHAVRGEMAAEVKQVAMIEHDLAGIVNKPYVAGFALWCFNDYATLRKKRYKRHSGIVDAWRLPKMSSALLQAKYLKEPFIRVFGNWGGDQRSEVRGPAVGGINQRLAPPQAGSEVERTTDNGQLTSEPREIHIFTNCDTVVASRNGKELWSMNGRTHLVREVDFEPGELIVTGVSADGRVTDRLVSYGEARRVEVQPEKTEGDAGIRETVGMTIRILDEQGNPVADWKGNVHILVRGPAVLRAYSDADAVPLSGGLGRTFVTGTGETGTVTVNVSSGALEPGEATICYRD